MRTIRFEENGQWERMVPEGTTFPTLPPRPDPSLAVEDEAPAPPASTGGDEAQDAADRPLEEIQADVVRAIATVYDPEIPVDVYQLGLIYDVFVTDEREVRVKMTLTSPACFAAQILPGEVRVKASRVPGVREAKVEIVWDPPWNPSMMSEAAKLALNMPW